jgi:diguanylate cyclase (GGDEF)-like protein/putative nucleotidyltransferase with HDIG domain
MAADRSAGALTMHKLSPFGRVYVTLVVLAGALFLGRGVIESNFDQPLLFLSLAALSSLAAALKVTLPLTASGSTMSVSYAVDFASLLLIGPDKTMMVAATSALSQCLLNRKEQNPLHRTLFSMASLVVTVQAAGVTMRLLGDPDSTDPLSLMAGPLIGAACVYFLVNTGLVAAAIAMSTGDRISTVWQTNFLWSAPSYFVGAATAAVAAWFVTHAGYWVAALMFAPVYLTFRTYKVYMGRIEDEQRHVQQTSDLHLATIEALARAIDAKDQTTQSHIRRVQHYAVRLANAAGLSPTAVQGVKTAALLHDIGKLAVPEHILSKPGPLTQEEFQKIRIHPQVGAEIIAAVPFPYPVAPLILSHHERWDGKGYPTGLAGEDIPTGARILTIVDYYDAVTTERPYHKAMSHESAVTLLQHEAGRALDPTLVRTFIELLPAMMAEVAAFPEEAPAVGHAIAMPGETAAGLVPASNGRSAYENIAHAHREIYALYEIAQTMGTSLGLTDTMALVSSKLTNIVPWSACALYLQQPDGETVKCHFAVGVDVPKFLGGSVKLGKGLSGWVMQNRRTLVNADPNVSFEAAGVPGTDLKSAIVCPLYAGSETLIGCLALYHLEPRRYTEDHRRLLERVAEQAGPVIANSLTFAQTQEDSLTDPLTLLPNRRSLFTHLSRELSRAERLKSEVGLLVLDVDEFKVINDTYGHHIGDRALREIASALQTGLRPYDLCVRYAGDEFIVVLSDCSRELADTRRRELQDRIGEIELEVRSGKTIRLGVSVGAAVYPHDGTDYEALLADADHRMYRDKTHRRRNRTRPSDVDPANPLFPPPVPPPSREERTALH